MKKLYLLLVVLFIVVVASACGKQTEQGGATAQIGLTEATQGGVASTTPNGDAATESSANTGSEDSATKNKESKNTEVAKEADASIKKPQEINAGELYGLTLSELEAIFAGAKYIPETAEGYGTWVTFEGQPYSFVLDVAGINEIGDSSKVTAIYILEGGKVTKELSVGMTFNEIARITGEDYEPEESVIEEAWMVSVPISDRLYALFEAPSSEEKTNMAILKAD